MTNLIYFTRPKLITMFDAWLDALVEAGVDTVTLTQHMGDVRLLNADDAARAKASLAARGIATPAMHGLFRNGYDLNASDANSAFDAHRAMLINAATLGVKTYVMHAGLPVDGRTTEQEWDAVERMLERLIPVAEPLGVILALENLPPNYVGHKPDALLAVINRFDSPSLKICFDSGHANMCGDATAFLEAIAPAVTTMHLHDNDGTGDRHLCPGEGTIDWDALIPAIRRCPALTHVEIEAFNREGHSHSELMALYRKLLS